MTRSVVLFLTLISLWGATCRSDEPGAVCFAATDWPEADRLFRRSADWLGADGAFSVDLGDGRTLWLFGDSWVDPAGNGSRNDARLIRNSVAVQTGSDPADAEIEYHWKSGADGGPTAFFSTDGDHWYWPGQGLRTGGGLILFLNRMRYTDTGLGFESVGWEAVLIRNPTDAPEDWQVLGLDVPADGPVIQVGFAGVLSHRGFLYAFGSADADKTHSIYAVRWPVERAALGNLMEPEWWAGDRQAWMAGTCGSLCEPIMTGGQAEMTIHFDHQVDRFIAIQTVGFGRAGIAMRTSASLTGGWSAVTRIFEPKENSRANVMLYAAKAHPQLEGADLVLTYATNTTVFSELRSDKEIYYPHFVRLSRCADRQHRKPTGVLPAP